MLDLDAGARRLGELGLGLNPGIDRFTGSILLRREDRRHRPPGARARATPRPAGDNDSALHWDLIVDTRDAGPDHGRRSGRDGRRAMAGGLRRCKVVGPDGIRSRSWMWTSRGSSQTDLRGGHDPLSRGEDLDPSGRDVPRTTSVIVGSSAAAIRWPVDGPEADGPTRRCADRVRQLVERLDAPKIEARDAAEASLIKLGRPDPAAPCPRPRRRRSPERQAAARASPRRRSQEAERGDRPSRRPRSRSRGRGSGSARRSSSSRSSRATRSPTCASNSGAEVDQPGARPRHRRQAVLRGARRSSAGRPRSRSRIFTGDGSIGLMAGVRRKAASTWSQYDGPVPGRVQAARGCPRLPGRDRGTANAQFEVAWEPRLRPMLLALKADELKIIDDQGETVEPQVMRSRPRSSSGPRTRPPRSTSTSTPPTARPRSSRSLKVKAEVTVPAGIKTFRFPSLAGENVDDQAGRRQRDARERPRSTSRSGRSTSSSPIPARARRSRAIARGSSTTGSGSRRPTARGSSTTAASRTPAPTAASSASSTSSSTPPASPPITSSSTRRRARWSRSRSSSSSRTCRCRERRDAEHRAVMTSTSIEPCGVPPLERTADLAGA